MDRALQPYGEGLSRSPFGHQPGVLGTLREDQVPRFFGAITNPERLPVQNMPLADMQAMQDRVDSAKVDALRSASRGKLPVVVRHNGMNLIADGHHRLAAQWMNGAESADVHFKDLQPYDSAVKRVAKDGGPTAGDSHVDAPLGSRRQAPTFDDTADDDLKPGQFRVAKMDDTLGLVFGWGIVCKVDGKPYYDLNVDANGKRVPEHVTEAAMAKAAVDFMENSRAGNEMHAGPDVGTYVFAFPLTSEIAKAMGLKTRKTGLMLAYKPPPSVYQKFRDGTYTGFSIEGSRVRFEEHD